jgi:cyclopropane fatty-acyl-phospholipid synthase-like methyltransferase
MPPGGGRLHAPATRRNRAAIAEVLAAWLPAHVPPDGTVLEIASGTGEHAVYLAARFPDLVWQPSDPDATNRRSIGAYRAAEGQANLKAPLDLDATAAAWPLNGPVDAVVCCNMIHIAPWAAAEGLFAGAACYLKPGGGLYLYGPFKRDGRHTAPSNEAFDASLRAQNPAWGVRDLEAVVVLAERQGFAAPLVEAMPANNLSLWFARQA